MQRYGMIMMAWVVILVSVPVMAQVKVQPVPQGGGQPAVLQAAGEKSEDAVAPGRQLTLMQLLQKGGAVMYPLYLCSILVVGFTVERIMTLRRRKVAPEALMQEVRSAIAQPAGVLDAAKLSASCEQWDSPLSRIIAAGMRRMNRTVLEVEKAMEDTAAREVVRLQRSNRVFSAVASVAPLLGLLGTATGIIRAFMTVAAMEDALGKSELLAGGIYEALVSTAAGLTIAIASLVLYLIFQERVEKLVTGVDEIATELADKLAAR